jgi:hypothetical protein
MSLRGNVLTQPNPLIQFQGNLGKASIPCLFLEISSNVHVQNILCNLCLLYVYPKSYFWLLPNYFMFHCKNSLVQYFTRMNLAAIFAAT